MGNSLKTTAQKEEQVTALKVQLEKTEERASPKPCIITGGEDYIVATGDAEIKEIET